MCMYMVNACHAVCSQYTVHIHTYSAVNPSQLDVCTTEPPDVFRTQCQVTHDYATKCFSFCAPAKKKRAQKQHTKGFICQAITAWIRRVLGSDLFSRPVLFIFLLFPRFRLRHSEPSPRNRDSVRLFVYVCLCVHGEMMCYGKQTAKPIK